MEVSYRQESGKQSRLGLIVALKVGRRDAFSGFRASRRVVGLRAKSAQPASAERCRGCKVLRGANPAELPIERPTKFETVLNMRTAHALGLSIATSLLLRADEVIE